MSEHVPLTYRAILFFFDCLFPLGGIVGHLFYPNAILSGFTSSPLLTSPSVATQVLLDSSAGWFAGLAFIHLFLQTKASNKRSTWAPVIAMVAIQDIFQIFGFLRGMYAEGRLSRFSNWTGTDVGNIGGYALITLIRVVFVAGSPAFIGAGSVRSKKEL